MKKTASTLMAVAMSLGSIAFAEDKAPDNLFGQWLDNDGFVTPGPKIKNWIDSDKDRIDDRLQAGNPTTTLPAEVCPCPTKARQGVFETSQFHLKNGFASLGAISKHINDYLVPIDYGSLAFFFPIPLLPRSQLVIENNNVAIGSLRKFKDFLYLSFA